MMMQCYLCFLCNGTTVNIKTTVLLPLYPGHGGIDDIEQTTT